MFSKGYATKYVTAHPKSSASKSGSMTPVWRRSCLDHSAAAQDKSPHRMRRHDAELYRAYTEEAERLRDEGANIHRIVLENDLKREYQEFLQKRNRDRDDSDGRPGRDPLEIEAWAREHDLPRDDQGHVQFPDVRIEYDIDGRDHTLDVEVTTPH